MPSIVHLMGRMIWKRRQSDTVTVPDTEFEVPLRLGEILAASTIPEFAGLPLELWPGYRNRAATDEAEDNSRRAAQSRLVSWND
jgi:hypothetical protein